MKNRELITLLQRMDPELETFTAIDAEGNGYNPVYFDPEVMVAVLNDEGKVIDVLNDDQMELEDSGYDESQFKRIIVI